MESSSQSELVNMTSDRQVFSVKIHPLLLKSHLPKNGSSWHLRCGVGKNIRQMLLSCYVFPNDVLLCKDPSNACKTC